MLLPQPMVCPPRFCAAKHVNMYTPNVPQSVVSCFWYCLPCAVAPLVNFVALVDEFAASDSKPSPLAGLACAKLAVVLEICCRTRLRPFMAVQRRGQSCGRTSPTSTALCQNNHGHGHLRTGDRLSLDTDSKQRRAWRRCHTVLTAFSAARDHLPTARRSLPAAEPVDSSLPTVRIRIDHPFGRTS